MKSHLTNDELVNRLYGLAGDDAHLESCSECGRRWSDLLARRAQFLRRAAGVEEPGEFFAAQRRSIQASLERAPRVRWVPAAVAAACVLAAGLFVYRPTAPRNDSADAQLFSDVYSMEQSVEPLAAAPIHALFEERQ